MSADTDEILTIIESHGLQEVKPLNAPGREFKLRDHNIGHTVDHGEHVTVDVDLRLAYREGVAETVDHETISGRWEISLGALVWKARKDGQRDARHNDIIAGGQCTDTVRKISPRLADLWETWHLNGMSAACVDLPEHVDTRAPSGEWPVCSETGYRWGSAWLYRPLPADVVREVLEILT